MQFVLHSNASPFNHLCGDRPLNDLFMQFIKLLGYRPLPHLIRSID
ncbi:hypothetical protein IQ268_20785 [Oculatella sp. LEGE 06141]|nr:hypothetical protein [Oculatella sp. LEGE 06141]MBE9180999.1 hypothetical protein [Oculatella sp. LEGE 06141]